jgi:ketosteroid isomerase-like protein
MDNHAIVSSFLLSWGAQDVELSLGHFDENVFYTIHTTANALPFGGEWHGREAIRELLFVILKDFDVLKYDEIFVRASGNTVRANVHYIYRHRPTGEVLEGTRRLVFKLQDGLIVRIEAFHDASLVEAFMQLTNHRIETNQLLQPPKLPRRRAREDSGAGA